MTDEIIHLAGAQITFDGVIRQRCCWCGALIEEREPAMMAVAIDETASQEVQGEEVADVGRAHWEGFVAVAGTNPVAMWSVDEPEDGKAPERSCMRLLPRLEAS